DSGVFERALAVDLGHDERDARVQPIRRGLVHADSSGRGGGGYQLATELGADGEEAHVEVAGAECALRRLLDLEIPEIRTSRAPRGERSDVRVPALDEVLDRHLS